MKLDKKIAIVTGGASGFGEGIVRKFLDEGIDKIIIGTRAIEDPNFITSLCN